MTGNLKYNNAGTLLKSYINPETTVTVTLPLFVNHKHLYVGDQLRFYKPAEEPAEKKRKVEVTDGITDFIKNCAEARMRPRKSVETLTSRGTRLTDVGLRPG